MSDAAASSFNIDEVMIEAVQEADHDAVRELFREGLLAGQLRDNDTGADIDNLQEGYFSDEGASGFWVARHEGRVIGMVGVQATGENIAELRRLRVTTGCRRRGVGAKLLEHAINFCRRRGYLKVVLDVRIERDAAIAIFEKFGFVHARTHEIGNFKTRDFYFNLYCEPGKG